MTVVLSLISVTAMCQSVSADTSYLEVGLGGNRNLTGCSDCWNDGDGTGAYIRLGWEMNLKPNNWKAGIHWTHLSQWDVGPPFNNDTESSVDHIGMYLRYEF